MMVMSLKYLSLKALISTSILPKPSLLFRLREGNMVVKEKGCIHLMSFSKFGKLINEAVREFFTGFWGRMDS